MLMEENIPEILEDLTQPIIPAWLESEAAIKHWHKLIRDIRLTRTLHPADGEQIALACDAWINYINCKKQVESDGMFYVSASGYQCPNACFSESQKWLKIYQNSLGKLGLNSGGRRGVKTNNPGAKAATTGRKPKQVSRFALTQD